MCVLSAPAPLQLGYSESASFVALTVHCGFIVSRGRWTGWGAWPACRRSFAQCPQDAKSHGRYAASQRARRCVQHEERSTVVAA